MSNLLAHGFTSSKADDVDPSLIQPSHFGSTSTNYTTNPTHVFSGGALGSLLFRDTGSIDGATWLADVAAGSYLRSGGVGVAPVWSTLTLPNSATQGDLLIASSANVIGSLADVAGGSVLVSGGVGSAPAFSASPSLTDLTLTGVGKFANGLSTAPSIASSTTPANGLYFPSASTIVVMVNNNESAAFVQTGTQLSSGAAFGWTSAGAGGTKDTILLRDAANTLGQRNGTNAQVFKIYNTFTDASNYERLFVGFSANVAFLAAQAGGTGTARELQISGNGVTNAITLSTGGTSRWRVNHTNSGAFEAVTDNAVDIGASGANRPRTIYAGTSVLVAGATGGLGYATGAGGTVTQLTSKATGVTLSKVTGQITLNAAALAADTTVSFVLTNTAIAVTDLLILNHISGGTVGSYLLEAQAAAGSATIVVRNITPGSLSEAIVISFAVLKAVTA